MEYYQSGKHLISHNLETNQYVIKTRIGVEKTLLSEEDFKKLPKQILKREKFNELLNNYYRNAREEWKQEGMTFRSMENFETDKDGNCINYDLTKIPTHYIDSPIVRGPVFFVYHHSRVYYLQWAADGDPSRGRLIDAMTLDLLKYVRPRNCSPIMNKDKKRIL